LARVPSLSQYRFSVATTQEDIPEKTWNELFFVVPLQHQK
jgi:hypothetical protein